MKKPLGELLVGLALLIAGAVISYFVFRPAPLAFAQCEPLKGDAPLTVRCVNESNYYTNIVWSLGVEGEPKIKDAETIRHEYRIPGRYKVSLKAHGQGPASEWSQHIRVAATNSLSTPVELSVIARTRRDTVVRTTPVQISRTKDDHPVTFSDHSRTYTETVEAAPGFKIVDASFEESSAARASDITTRITPDGSAIDFSYRLTSGPAVDRYRGWLRGDLVLRQERVDPEQHLALHTGLKVDKFGSYALDKSVGLDSVDSIEIVDSDGNRIALGDPTGVLVSDEENLAFSLEENAGQVFLKVEQQR